MTNPYLAGFRSRCPRCGEGKLFAGYLTVAPRCGHCGLDLAEIDTGDGPAFFVVLVVGAIVAPLALALETLKQPTAPSKTSPFHATAKWSKISSKTTRRNPLQTPVSTHIRTILTCQATAPTSIPRT